MAQEPTSGPSTAWVAIVDDDESVRRALLRILRVEGIEATAFGCAHEFLAVGMSRGAPSCLVLDVHLGATSMSGFDLHAILRERGAAVPVILMTAHDEVTSADLASRVGADGFLRKPFERAQFVTMVQRARATRAT